MAQIKVKLRTPLTNLVLGEPYQLVKITLPQTLIISTPEGEVNLITDLTNLQVLSLSNRLHLSYATLTFLDNGTVKLNVLGGNQ